LFRQRTSDYNLTLIKAIRSAANFHSKFIYLKEVAFIELVAGATLFTLTASHHLLLSFFNYSQTDSNIAGNKTGT
jgi:hypothetical protein